MAGAGEAQRRATADGDRVSFRSGEDARGRWLHNFARAPNVTRLSTSKWSILVYLTFTSVRKNEKTKTIHGVSLPKTDSPSAPRPGSVFASSNVECLDSFCFSLQSRALA